MKKILLGAIAAAAIGAPSAFAETSGTVDLNYGNTEFDGGSDFDQYRLGGAAQFDAWSGWALTLEGSTSLQQGSSTNDYSQNHFALHADTNTGAWDFGGWAGLLGYYGSGGVTVGGETRTNFGNLSLEGSIGYGAFESFNDYSAWDLRVQGAYFITPNFAVNGGATQTWFDTSSDTEMLDLSIGAQYGFGNGFEVYGGYVNTDVDYNTGDYETDTFNLGLRYHFNGGTLQDIANDGPSWGGVQALSDSFTRWD